MVQDTKYFVQGRIYKVKINNKVVDFAKCIEIERNRNDDSYVWFMGNDLIDGVFRIKLDENAYEFVSYKWITIASCDLIMYNDESITIWFEPDNTSKQYFNLKR